MSRRARLNERQLDVLRWVDEGCPPGRWGDHTYKTSAQALAGRGLLVVSKRRGVWSAAITEDGRYYLANGHYPPRRVDRARKPTRKTAPTMSRTGPGKESIAVTELLHRVQDADGVLRVEDPDAALRAAYRRALSAAITSGAVPQAYRLRHTGRDHGDLVIRLVKAEDDPGRPEPLPPIRIPDTLEKVDAQVTAVCEGVAVSTEQRPRALRIVQGIADEAIGRGHRFTARPDGTPGFRISIDEDAYDFTISEESEKVDRYPEEEVAAKKYPWQRVSAQRASVPSGRLVLQLGDGYHPSRWVDRKRWTLVDKLPDAFALIEGQAQAAREAREQAREAARRRHEQWESAAPRARARYLADLNRRRVLEQAQAWRHANDLREYAAAVQKLAEQGSGGDDRQRLAAWAVWVRQDADRLDPLQSPDMLGFHEPAEIDPAALDAYMPPGMTVRHPLDAPSRHGR